MIYSKAADLAYRRAIWLRCQTVVVTFHEAVWVVAGTAAPVIALAGVVSLGDTAREFRAFSLESMNVPQTRAEVWLYEQRFHQYLWVSGVGLFNLLLQAALLAVSLTSLADQANSVPPLLAIVAAVGGLLLLLVGTLGAIPRAWITTSPTDAGNGDDGEAHAMKDA
jgi:hypothetical protein